MTDEILTIFDEKGNIAGTAPRDEVHRLGLWHETFHFWLISLEQGIPYIYLQLRSEQKKDYSGLLDITAAGHLLAGETVEDGVREVQEELGLVIAFDKLIPLGTIPYEMTQEGIIDKERAHVFVYQQSVAWDDFALQEEEVAVMVRAELHDFHALWTGISNEIEIQGFRVSGSGERIQIKQTVNRGLFVPHEIDYYERVLTGIQAIFRE
ncbi:putative Nudix hydrolase [Paenibacillus albidus]|uniref:Nudix hydrolase n=1 Tax=Paenibacillus albidus TaxID=2041023 RepID=A0A917CB92_9BACL|nr:NUDIX domain-containing protein [Paenibacillus albidus]GGF79640.1 putative Nudix hydrolase [Paenibacillus albidus]